MARLLRQKSVYLIAYGSCATSGGLPGLANQFSREQILKDFEHYPVVQCYTESDLETHFRIKGAKVVGFAKSGLAQSLAACPRASGLVMSLFIH